MTVATLDVAERLKTEELQAVYVDATLTARWGDDAVTSSQSCCLTRAADADAEATRQVTGLLGLPRADDTAVIVGIHTELEGETVAIPYNGTLGIAGIVNFLVVRAQPNRAANLTALQGQVRL